MEISVAEKPSSSRRNGASKTPLPLPLAQHDTPRSVCNYHRGLEHKVDRVLRTQRRHSVGMWAIGVLVALIGIAVPSYTSVQVARIGASASTISAIERKLDVLLKR